MGVKELIKEMDMYGQPIQFSYNKKTQFTTVCGGCVSLVIIIFLVIYFVLLILDIINKKYPYILSTINPLQTGPNLILSADPWAQYLDSNRNYMPDNISASDTSTFEFSVGFYNTISNSFISIDPSLFIVSFSNIDGQIYPLFFQKCKRFGVLDSNTFSTYNVSSTYCLNDIAILNASIYDQSNSYISIDIDPCQNSTYAYTINPIQSQFKLQPKISPYVNPRSYSPISQTQIINDMNTFKSQNSDPYYFTNFINNSITGLDVVCQSAETINTLMDNLKVLVYFMNNDFNLTNYDSQISPFFTPKEYPVVSNIRNTINYYFGRNSLLTYNSIFPSFLSSASNLIYTLTLNNEESYYEDYDTNSPSITTIRIYSSPNLNQYTIKYDTLLDVLGLVGGLSKVFMIVGSLLVVYISNLKFKESLINDFYSVIDPKNMKFVKRSFEKFLEYKYDYYEFMKSKTVGDEFKDDDPDNELNKFFNKEVIRKIYYFKHKLNKNQNKNKNKNDKSIDGVDGLDNENEQEQQILASDKEFAKYEVIYEVFKSETYNRMNFSTLDIIANLFCFCCLTKNLKTKNKIYKLASNRLAQDTDFLSIVRSVQEFEAFKKVFFEEDQLNLFNSVVNKPITIKEIEEIENKKLKIKEEIVNLKKINSELENTSESYRLNKDKIKFLERQVEKLEKYEIEDEEESGEKSKLQKLEEALNTLLTDTERSEYETDKKLIQNLKIDEEVIKSFLKFLEENQKNDKKVFEEKADKPKDPRKKNSNFNVNNISAINNISNNNIEKDVKEKNEIKESNNNLNVNDINLNIENKEEEHKNDSHRPEINAKYFFEKFGEREKR